MLWYLPAFCSQDMNTYLIFLPSICMLPSRKKNSVLGEWPNDASLHMCVYKKELQIDNAFELDRSFGIQSRSVQ